MKKNEKMKKTSQTDASKTTNDNVVFSKKSIMIFFSAFASLIIGYLLLIIGEIFFAPIFLVLGYVVLIPIAIIKK